MKKTLAVICCLWLLSVGYANSYFSLTDFSKETEPPTVCYDAVAMDTELIGVYAPITTSATTVTLNITVKNLVNVVSISHMLVWNPAILRVNRSNLGSSLTNLNGSISPVISLAQFSATTDSTLSFNWVQFNNSFPQSLPDDAIIYSIIFDIVGPIGSGTLVREFPESERPLALSRPRNMIAVPNGSSTNSIPYTPVNTLITTTNGNTNTPPTVSFSSPFDGQSFTTGNTITVTANANDVDGTVTGVELFYDGTSQNVDNFAPYQWSISNLTAGSHTLQVIATDDDNATAQQTITINVFTPNIPPSVSITSPNNGQSFTQGTPIVVSATASDSDGTIAQTELFFNNISQGIRTNAPYQWTINGASVGSQNIRVEARDNSNATSQTAINISVVAAANVPPTISLISPTNGQIFTEGTSINVTASANDSDGSIVSVEFFYNGNLQSTDNTAPYAWTTPNLTAGTQTLQVVATDNNGATAQQTISITVNANNNGNNDPDYPDPVSDCNVDRLFTFGQSVVPTGTYQVSQDISTSGTVALNGSNQIVFQAGNSITLTPGFSVKPNNGGFFIARIEQCTLINDAPTVAFIQPLANDVLDIGTDLVVRATATDVGGSVASVQLFYDGILQGTDNVAPYQWVVPNLTVGTHTLQVIATDDGGATAQQTITITVADLNDAPIVQFVQPTNGQSFAAGSNLMINATAFDNDGLVNSVAFFYDGILQGTDNLAPYQWMLFNLMPGTHILRLVATDNEGATGEQVITITVTNTPPVLSFVMPQANESFMLGEDVTVQASASDDSEVVSVTLYLNNVIQGINNLAPYQWLLSNPPAGTHILRLVAVDDSGAQTEITRTIQVVANTNPPIVSFISPVNGNVFNAGIDLNVQIAASDSDGSIVSVRLYYDGILQGTDFAAPYQWTISSLSPGLHTLKALATDNGGATSERTISISVNQPNLSIMNTENSGIEGMFALTSNFSENGGRGYCFFCADYSRSYYFYTYGWCAIYRG